MTAETRVDVTAPTVPRECRAEDAWVWEPGRFAGVTAPTLMLLGSDTTLELRAVTDAAAAALAGPTVRVLEGHAHLAIRTDPEEVARMVLDFLRT